MMCILIFGSLFLLWFSLIIFMFECLGGMQVIKAKKRRLGRAQKTIGDYCLLAGSPVDANAHYSTALELARLTGDYFWYAGALEGSVCALLVFFSPFYRLSFLV